MLILLLLIQFLTVQEPVAPPVEVVDLEVLAREYKGHRFPDPRTGPPPPGPVSRDDLMGGRRTTSHTGQPTIEERSSELNKVGRRTAPLPPPPRDREPRSRFIYEYRVTVKNTSPKKIRAIEWEYQLTDGSGATLISQKFFRCAGNMKSDAIKVLTGSTLSPPTRVVDADSSVENKQKAVINRVEYSDGSTWTRDGWKQDDSPGNAPLYCVFDSK